VKADLLRIGRFVASTTAEGPGVRCALWVQGCSLRCRGCCNPELFDPRGGGAVDPARLASEILNSIHRVEGITLLGGEPFDQAAALVPLVRRLRHAGLGVIAFTGYTLGDLHGRGDPCVDGLLDATDLLVDGPFDATRPETERRWVGSENQQFRYLTDRYDPSLERAGPDETVEVRLGADAVVRVNGWPAMGDWARRIGRLQ